jgi:hypothetical protein
MAPQLRFALAALLLASSLALAACESSGSKGSTSPGDVAGLVVSLNVDSQVRAGETVSLRLTVRNVSDRPVQLALAGQQSTGFADSYDLVVTRPDGAEVWRFAHGQAFEGILSFKTLRPGEELILKGEWDQRDNRGHTVTPGTYLMRGVFKYGDPPDVQTLETEPSTLSISR